MRRNYAFLCVPLLLLAGIITAAPATADVVSGGALTSGTAVTGTITQPNRDIDYTFTATSGRGVTLDISASSWGTGSSRLYVFDPAGTLYINCSLTLAPNYCDFVPNVSGTWKVRLDATAGAVGSATFTLGVDQNKGVLTVGTPISTSIAIKGQNAEYTFAGTKGTNVTLNTSATNWGTGSAALRVFDPAGVASPRLNCSMASAPAFCDVVITRTGTWKVVLNPNWDAVGSATFTLANDQVKGALTAGVQVTTVITTKGQNAGFTFPATVGVHTAFDVSAANWSTSAQLLFYDPEGSPRQGCHLEAGPSLCEITPTGTGTWTVVLNPAGVGVGSATIAFAKDQNKGLLSPGTAITTTIANKGVNAQYTLAATSGKRVNFDFTAANWGTGAATLFVYKPAGYIFITCPVVAGQLCHFTPDVTGTWKVELDPHGFTTGSTTFKFINDQVKGALSAGTPISTTIAARGQNADFTFAGTAGVHQTFDVTASNWGTGEARLAVYKPSGDIATYCVLRSGPTYCDLTPDETGTWRVVLDPQENAVGSATFAMVDDQSGGGITSFTQIDASISIKGQNANYSFAAVAGTPVTFGVTATDWGTGGATLYFYQPDGSLYDQCNFTDTPTRCNFDPNVTGTWKVTLDPYLGSVGTASFGYGGPW